MKKSLVGGLVVLLLAGLVSAAHAQYKPIWQPNGKLLFDVNFEGVSGSTRYGDSMVTINVDTGQSQAFIKRWDNDFENLIWTMPFANTSEARSVQMDVTSNGDIIVAWQDLTKGNNDIYAKIYSGATGLSSGWNAQISNTADEERFFRIIPDRSGGAYIIFRNEVTGIVYINHVGANGSTWASPLLLFPVDENKTISYTGIDGNAVVVAASGEAVLAALVGDYNGAANLEGLTLLGGGNWTDVKTSGDYIFTVVSSPGAAATAAALGKLYLYKLNKSDLSKVTSFGTGGVVTIGDHPYSGVAAASEFVPRMLVDSNGYLYIVWIDMREGNIWSDIYISKVDPASGAELWTKNVTNAPGVQSYVWFPEIVSANPMVIDEASGVLGLIWSDFRTERNTFNLWSSMTLDLKGDIFMQMVNLSDGSMPIQPVVLSSYPSLEAIPEIASAQSSGYFITSWADLRYYSAANKRMGLYLQKVENVPTQITGAATIAGTSDLIAVSGYFGADPTGYHNNDFADEDYNKVEINGAKAPITSWSTREIIAQIAGGLASGTDYNIVVTAYGQASNTWDLWSGTTDGGGSAPLPQVTDLQGSGTNITYYFYPPASASTTAAQTMNIFIITPSGRQVSIRQAAASGYNEIELDRNIFSSAGLYKVKVYYGDTFVGETAISYMGR